MFRNKFPHRSFALATLVAGLLAFTSPPSAQAGCGCSKAPPLPAAIRPEVTYAGTPVTLFGSGITVGQLYTVTFKAMNGTTATVSSVQAASKRDLADGVYKAQLIVTIPTSLPLGPMGVTVKRAGQTAILLSIPDTSFTVAPQPITVASQPGSYSYQNYKAAVGRDGRVYISLNLTGITHARTFKAQAKGYALRFTKDDTVFYNTQGFLMQLANTPIPGLFSINSGKATDSDIAQYARHEFNTYFLQHAEHLSHSVDAADGNWHLDGTPHINHDHLILVIDGTVNNATPAAGSTPAFTLQLDSYSFFQNGLVGLNDLVLNSSAITDSYNSKTGSFGSSGDVLSNAQILVNDKAVVNGNGTAASFLINGSGKITGKKTTTSTKTQFIPVAVPNGLSSLGDVTVASGTRRTITTGSYQASQILVNGTGELRIDNSNGPVTLYVTGMVQVNTGGKITVTNPNPEMFAVYVAGTSAVQIDAQGSFYGVVYAPQSDVRLNSNGTFYGSFIGNYVTLNSGGKVHFDTALRGE